MTIVDDISTSRFKLLGERNVETTTNNRAIEPAALIERLGAAGDYPGKIQTV